MPKFSPIVIFGISRILAHYAQFYAQICQHKSKINVYYTATLHKILQSLVLFMSNVLFRSENKYDPGSCAVYFCGYLLRSFLISVESVQIFSDPKVDIFQFQCRSAQIFSDSNTVLCRFFLIPM